MAILFLNDGSATGTAPVGTGPVVLLPRANTPDFVSPTWLPITPEALAALRASEPNMLAWKVAGNTLVPMSGAEKASVVAAQVAAAQAAAAQDILLRGLRRLGMWTINNGTLTIRSNIKARFWDVRAQAAGGGSGGASFGPTAIAIGASGGGGTYAERRFAVDPDTDYACALGAPGAAGLAGATNPGGNGGTLTLTVGAVTLSVPGGRGGAGANNGVVGNTGLFVPGGAGGGPAVNADRYVLGGTGEAGQRLSGTMGRSGAGGFSHGGGRGADGQMTTAAGLPADSFGAGASGGYTRSGVADVSGAVGGVSVLWIVEWGVSGGA
jgi:hypothetical protein